MPEFFNVLPPAEARRLLLAHLPGGDGAALGSEQLSTAAALGRTTAAPSYAPHPLPQFRRSTMDGFAVRAADTYGASDQLPAFLQVIGEIAMGAAAVVALRQGQAAMVHTGGMIPETADAVVQIEHTQQFGGPASAPPFEIEVLRPVADGQNVLQVGEDVALGAEVLPQGFVLRPQDIGGLLALGIMELAVARRPRVAILATGDEVVAPAEFTGPGQIRDINSYTVSAQIEEAGGLPVRRGIVPDDLAALKRAARLALDESDMLVISAGSSVSLRDMTVQVIEELGQPGVLLHGVATRPGKPTIAGVVANKPVLGLPGNPVSAMIQFDMLGRPAIHHLLGNRQAPRRGFVWAQLSQNVASQSGRQDYVPARLHETPAGLQATPVFGKSNLIYTLVNADGIIEVPLDSAGLEAGELVQVRLF